MATVDTTQAANNSYSTTLGFGQRLRAIVRLCMMFGWTGLCWLVLKLTAPLALISRPLRKRAGKAISVMWIRGINKVIGLRLIVSGEPPKAPYFLVANHLAWMDFYAGYSILDALAIVEDPIRTQPLVGPLMSAMDPIFVRRVKEDTDRVKNLMVQAIRDGRSVMMAPETPWTTIKRGSGVRQFRGGLMDAAVITRKPVHYLSISYRTPKGCMPPSKALIFGPNPFLPTPDGKIPESEYAMYERQTFMQHLMKLLSLPYFEVTFTFGADPIFCEDRIELANRLHEAVSANFVPIE